MGGHLMMISEEGSNHSHFPKSSDHYQSAVARRRRPSLSMAVARVARQSYHRETVDVSVALSDLLPRDFGVSENRKKVLIPGGPRRSCGLYLRLRVVVKVL